MAILNPARLPLQTLPATAPVRPSSFTLWTHAAAAFGIAFLASSLLLAQGTSAPRAAARPPHPAPKHHSAATSKTAKPAAAPTAAPQEPAKPNWPVNEKPARAKITWDAQGLAVQASNSSLDQILHEIGTDTGARITGLSKDERIFGTYGPGPARQVISQLLEGTGYNVLIIGDQGGGTPRAIELSLGQGTAGSPQAGPATRSPSDETPDDSEDSSEEQPLGTPPQDYQPPMPPLQGQSPAGQPPQPQPIRNPFGGDPPRTPQQIQQQMQQQQNNQ